MLTDPLNISIEGRGEDTSMPYLAEGNYPFQIAESNMRVNKKQTGHNWHLKFALTAPGQTPDGKEVKVNTPVFVDIALQPAEDAADPNGFKRQIFQMMDGIMGTTKDTRGTFNKEFIDSCVGRNVTAKVVVEEYPTGSGQFNNKVRNVKPA